MSPRDAGIGSAARPLDAVAVAIMTFLCFTWGFNQVAIKLALPDIPPLIQATLRSIGASLVIVVWARLRGVSLTRHDATLVPGIAAGVLFGLEFILIYRGLAWTTASRAAVFLYTAPLFVALGARWFLPGDRLSPTQWIGLVLAFTGLIVAFGVPQAVADPHALLGDLMVIGGGAAWGATTLVIKGSRLATAPAEKTLAYQLLVSVPILAIGALLVGERLDHAPDAAPLAWLAYQTVWVVSITYAIWFALVKRYAASRLSAFTFLTPIFGVAAGHFVLGDPITPGFALAVALVVAGLLLVNRPR
jgi:drug/metabolite transporter (DMT)-like permease